VEEVEWDPAYYGPILMGSHGAGALLSPPPTNKTVAGHGAGALSLFRWEAGSARERYDDVRGARAALRRSRTHLQHACGM
jgi:hypothetical protein